MNLEWMDSALCAEVGTDIFFPEQGESSRPAVRICHDCPVARECLAYGVATSPGSGIYGGLVPKQRRNMVVS